MMSMYRWTSLVDASNQYQVNQSAHPISILPVDSIKPLAICQILGFAASVFLARISDSTILIATVHDLVAT